jgi:uncharacterized iron-regulated membrane protein
MNLLQKIHLYVGLILGLIFFVMALSGTILVYRAEIIGAFMDQLPPSQKLTIAQEVRALEILPVAGVSFIDFPHWEAPYLRVWYLNGDIEYYNPANLEKIAIRGLIVESMMFLADLHIHLLAGERGEHISGFFGIALIAMILSGLWLWWPGRRGFKFKHILPKNLKRNSSLKSHRALGVICSLLLLVIVSSGVGLIFYPQSQKVIAALTKEDVGIAIELTTRIQRMNNRPMDSIGALVEQFHEQVPDGAISRYYAPTKDTPTIARLRYRYPEDWATYGASFITVDYDQGIVTDFIDYRLSPQYNRISRKFYPVHA